ncbi:branched-chain amino acid aminotransferase [Chloropicon primus]|uniref:Branched-chain-amino-acid aminotransferase n=1 Tax=Chloropicon primus TaxID=1764295 RepID=A0A5B8MQY3_9CHLO|nr:branched-chain amino acid aminotransferase [Chloropicon primus]UPR02342.1 branched-chain amino acid aminotransferase [Chloropicon primus]|eukprot:QDZ23128.1 branched-chain amino acid aminotransferase [Chloropicon primus]
MNMLAAARGWQCTGASIACRGARTFAVSATPKESVVPEGSESDGQPGTFYARDLEIKVDSPENIKPLPEDLTELSFGKDFSPHVFKVCWSAAKGWGTPKVKPFESLSIHPAAPVIHYGVGCFEGMKAYASESEEGDILLFRPDMNLKRFNFSMSRLSLPAFDEKEFLGCLKRMLQVDKDHVPRAPGYSLYLRPFAAGTTATLGVAPPADCEINVIACPVGPYYAGGLVPIDVLLDEDHVRAFPGGTGQYKVGGNYAPTLQHLQRASKEFDCKQVLYTLPGQEASTLNERYVAECGAMNMFFLLENGASGERELVTPPLDGTILAGVTRDTILQLCGEWDDFKVSERMISVREIEEHASEGNLVEVFGSGTACIIQPIKCLVKDNGARINVRENTGEDKLSDKIYKAITDIQYGRVKHRWSESIYAP